jgi:hypothetical protein
MGKMSDNEDILGQFTPPTMSRGANKGKTKGLPGVKAPTGKGNKKNPVLEQAVEMLKSIDLNAKTIQNRHKDALQRTNTVEATYEAFKHFEEALGGRRQLIDTLQHCPENSNGYNLMQKLLADPDFLEYAVQKGNDENVRYSLAVLCKRHRIPRDSKIAEIAAETLNKVAASTPLVVEQLITDSTNRYDPCDKCEGTGRLWKMNDIGEWMYDPETGEHMLQLCGYCRGQGKMFVRHDPANRKEFLKLAGLVKDKEPLIQQTFNQQAFMPGNGSFERILKDLDMAVIVKNEPLALENVPNTIYESEVIDGPKE